MAFGVVVTMLKIDDVCRMRALECCSMSADCALSIPLMSEDRRLIWLLLCHQSFIYNESLSCRWAYSCWALNSMLMATISAKMTFLNSSTSLRAIKDQ